MEEKRKRGWLFQAFILSVSCNLCLVGVIYFLALREGTIVRSLPFYPQASQITIPQNIVSSFQNFSMQELIVGLEDSREIAKGFSMQSVILGLLISHFELDIERCLGYQPCWTKSGYHLSTKEYARVAAFLQKERYPFTFSRVVKHFQKNPGDAEFVRWLLYRPEILSLKQTAQSVVGGIQESSILKLLLEAGPDPICALHKEVKEGSVDIDENWHRLLIRSLLDGSKTAAYLLVVSDPKYAQRLPFEVQLKMVELMETRTEEAHRFVQNILEREDLEEPLKSLALKREADFSY
jgi:hypothetical protein